MVRRILYRIRNSLLVAALPGLAACSQQTGQTLVTLADARSSPAQAIDTGKPGDSPGDILVFDQPLLDADRQVIGNITSMTCKSTPSLASTVDQRCTYINRQSER